MAARLLRSQIQSSKSPQAAKMTQKRFTYWRHNAAQEQWRPGLDVNISAGRLSGGHIEMDYEDIIPTCTFGFQELIPQLILFTLMFLMFVLMVLPEFTRKAAAKKRAQEIKGKGRTFSSSSSSFLGCPESCWWLVWHFRWCSQSPHFSSGHKSLKWNCCTVSSSFSLSL